MELLFPLQSLSTDVETQRNVGMTCLQGTKMPNNLSQCGVLTLAPLHAIDVFSLIANDKALNFLLHNG